MRATQKFILMVVVALVAAAAIMSPGRQEHAAMLAGEGRHKEAIALLESRLADAPNDPDLLGALGRSYAMLGDVARARDSFDAYLRIRPDDLTARWSETELLLQNGMTERYLDTLARVVAAEPTPDRVTRLIELYRLHGRFEDELVTLQTYARKAMLEPPQLERLGALFAERGNWREAQEWLELADRKAPPDASAGRLLLLEVAIHNNELDRIYPRAQSWIKAWRNPHLSGKLIIRMARSGHTAPAARLALEYPDAMPGDTFQMVDLLAHRGRQDLAIQILTRWADRTAKPTASQLRAFVQASARVGDVRGPLAKLVQLARAGADPVTQGEMVEELAATFGKSVLAGVRPVLSSKVLLTRPLFAAELSLFEGNGEMARWFLDRVEPAKLPPERSADWLALLHRVETDADVVKRLTVLWNDGRLPPELLPYFADEAVKLGRVKMHDSIWDSARK